MKGFIIYSTYRIINNKPHIYLFGRLENNQPFLTINEFKPYFYIKTKDLEKAKSLTDLNFKKTDLKTFKNQPVTKIISNTPQELLKLRELFENNYITCYEADIRFTTRFLIDKKLHSSLDIQGDYTIEQSTRVYKNPELKPTYFIPKLKIISIDIETSSDSKDLYSIALYSEDYQKILILSKEKFKNTILCNSEKELLERFKEQIISYDPDIITGWNVIDFDLKYLQKKFKQHNLEFNLGKDNTTTKLKISDNFFKDSKVEIVGRQVLDGISLLKSSFINLPDYKLDTAASIFLRTKKLLKPLKRGEQIDLLFKNNKQKLINYNINDAKLAYEIIKKSNAFDLTIKRSLITGLPLNRVSASIASLDFLYLKKARKKHLVCPSSKFKIKQRPITGGYVMQSIPGIYDYVIVLDFLSLYPSIIQTFNIDPASYLEKKQKNSIQTPNKAYFKNTQGILPLIIKDLLKKREKAKKQKDELQSYAIKILMNSFFGSLANPYCRFFNTKIANSITHFGQYIIKLTAKKIQQKNYQVIYEDTDSVFVNTKAKSLHQAKKIGKYLQDEINNFYKTFIKQKYNRKSYLKLEFEKCFIKFLMPKIRGSEKGAKKRYAGLLIKNGKEKLDITGLEAIRMDWTELAKQFQIQLLNNIFHKKEVTGFIKNFVKDLKAGKYDKKLIYKKQLRKDLESYAINPPHLKAAKKLEFLENNVIEYVMTTDGPEPIQNQKHKIDYNHYIEKQLKPIANSILLFFNTDFNTILKNSKQTTLFNSK